MDPKKIVQSVAVQAAGVGMGAAFGATGKTMKSPTGPGVPATALQVGSAMGKAAQSGAGVGGTLLAGGAVLTAKAAAITATASAVAVAAAPFVAFGAIVAAPFGIIYFLSKLDEKK